MAAAGGLPKAFRKKAAAGSTAQPSLKVPKADESGGFNGESSVSSSPSAMQSMMQSMMMQGQPNPMQSMMQSMMQGPQGMAGQSNPMQNMMQMMMMQKAMAASAPPQNTMQSGPNDAMQNMMQNMFQMGQMQALQTAMQQQQIQKAGAAIHQKALPSVAMEPTMDMSSWTQVPDPQDDAASSDPNLDHIRATQAAYAATQQAIYDQQMSFFQSVREQRTQTEKASRGGLSRYKDDYRAYLLCKTFRRAGGCENGARCEFAHCYEELHPASPDMPQDEAIVQSSLATLKQPPKEEHEAPKIQLRKKRDLCRKFKESGHCSRGNACPNAHGEAEIGKTAFVLYDKVKMEVCKAYKNNKCAYGASCIYAHGDHEIGQKRREWDAPPIKKRRGQQTIEEFRYEILRDPDAPAF